MATDRLLTVRECADFLACSTWAIYRLKREHRLPFRRLGRSLRFSRADVEAWSNRHVAMSAGRWSIALVKKGA